MLLGICRSSISWPKECGLLTLTLTHFVISLSMIYQTSDRGDHNHTTYIDIYSRTEIDTSKGNYRTSSLSFNSKTQPCYIHIICKENKGLALQMHISYIHYMSEEVSNVTQSSHTALIAEWNLPL